MADIVGKALIIDDDPLFQKIFSQKLISEGIDAEVADDGAKGIEKARNNKPDVIIIDLMMPNFSGLEAISFLKSDEATKNIPIYVTSALQSPEGIKRALALGVKKFVAKAEIDIAAFTKEIKKQIIDNKA